MMRLSRDHLARLAGVVLLCALAGAGCKSGSDLPRVAVGITPDFGPETPTVTTDFVSLEKSTVSGGRIILDVVVTDVSTPISGIALKLTIPSDIAKLEACHDGNLFAPGTCFINPTPKGVNEVFIGRTITNPEPPVAVVGSKTIVRLEFVVFAEGGGDIVFEAQNLGGGDASALLDSNGDPIFVNWFAGSLSGLAAP